jgi:hypothetical protein
MTRRVPIIALALLPIALPALAAPPASRPIVVKGMTFSSWTDYFTSDYFRANGLRCGTKEPVALEKNGSRIDAGPEDCGLDLTNPIDDYAPGALLEITVVVHRLESSLTGDGVFDDSLVRTQIDVLNEDFQALAGSPGEPGTDSRIRFKLATEDPDGQPSPGWTRTTNEFWFNDLPDPVNGNYYDELAWDPHRYLNIYTLSPQAPGGLILGYVPFFPQEGGVGTAEDGVRCLWNAFGRQSANAPYDQGRTVTHEVGHYLGLYHSFQDGCTAAEAPGCYAEGDRVCDTAPQSASNGGCPIGAESCGLPEPFRNYMDYTDDACMNNFTVEQARRIRCTIQHYRPDLARSVVGVPAIASRSTSLRLSNSPNPFRPSTEISFALEHERRVKLVITDVAGRIVRTLQEGSLSAGMHRLRWDGTDDRGATARAGVYFSRLSIDGRTGATKQMVMMQ